MLCVVQGSEEALACLTIVIVDSVIMPVGRLWDAETLRISILDYTFITLVSVQPTFTQYSIIRVKMYSHTQYPCRCMADAVSCPPAVTSVLVEPLVMYMVSSKKPHRKLG